MATRPSRSLPRLLTLRPNNPVMMRDRWNWWVFPQHTLVQALNHAEYAPAEVGNFHYATDTHLLAYVIRRASGLTPLALAERAILPSLGIDARDISWEANREGVQLAAHGLHMTPRHLAKIGQLYLQRGWASASLRLLPPALSLQHERALSGARPPAATEPTCSRWTSA